MGALFQGLDVNAAMLQANSLGQVQPGNFGAAFPNFSLTALSNLTDGIQSGNLYNVMLAGYNGLADLYKDETDPIKKAELYKQMQNLHSVLQNFPAWTQKFGQLKTLVSNFLASIGIGTLVSAASDLLDSFLGGTLDGNAEALAEKLGQIDLSKLTDAFGKLGNPPDDILGKFLPAGVSPAKLKGVMDSLKNGVLGTALTSLKDKLNGLLSNLTGAAADKIKGLIGKLDGLIGNKDIPGIAGGLGGVLGNLGSTALGGLTSGQVPGLDDLVGGLLGNVGFCEKYDTKTLTKEQSGDKKNGRIVDGTKTDDAKHPHDEMPDCPEVDCNTDTALVQRVQEYFTYQPPVNNRKVFENKQYHDYELNRGDRFEETNKQRKGGYVMKEIVPLTNNNPINEPRQDNRWRDACFVGSAPPDADYGMYGRPLTENEEPWPGVAGSRPLLHIKDQNQINCMVPKNTEITSPLLMDYGWRFRFMCTGDDILMRAPGDEYSKKMDYFKGVFHCYVPLLPKCALENDWKINENTWINKTYGQFKILVGNLLNSNSTVNSVLKNMPPSVKVKLQNLLNTTVSGAPECKPAYWVRLMMDNCANQSIILKSATPDLVFNPDVPKVGLSPRFCQPLRMTMVGQDEYDVGEYLKRTANGLLKEDYFPWIQYNRFKGPMATGLQQKWEATQPKRVIKGMDAFQNNTIDNLFANKQLKINDYAQHPVERIVDAAHPYSPRYDVAIFSDNGKNVEDRNIFEGATATKMIPGGIIKECIPVRQKGYFEYPGKDGKDCTVYCSAVNVDVLRFRYSNFRLCMGCQIDANQNAFWTEVNANRTYYFTQRCWNPAQGHKPGEANKSTDDQCHYGDKICHSCFDAAQNCALAASYCAACGLTGATCDKCAEYTKKCAEDTAHCTQCGVKSYAEATERARRRINFIKQPIYGPSATYNDGKFSKNWPVCSTRYDYPGDPILCTMAKAASGACAAQGALAQADENIGKPLLAEAAKCLNKNIHTICDEAAKPVYGLNFLKIRPRKAGAESADKDWTLFQTLPPNLKDADPPPVFHYRTYFNNHRPYMRWWDTGQEAFQMDPDNPDYACDLGANDTYIGVGREFNSIHGRKTQICGLVGGGGVGGNCFDIPNWKNKYPDLAGSEWAELKMYQANCFRTSGLNCLCQYEKIFKPDSSEDKALAMMSGAVQVYEKFARESDDPAEQAKINAACTKCLSSDETDKTSCEACYVKRSKRLTIPAGWRGYASTPAQYETKQSSPAIDINQQFPKLYGGYDNAIISGGLDKAMFGDIVVWPAGSGTLPHVAIVKNAQNAAAYGGDISNIRVDKLKYTPISGYRGWVEVIDANNGKLPDICGNTDMLGYGPPRTLYSRVEDLPNITRKRMEEQVSATYYCDDPSLGACVDRHWFDVIIYRPSMAPARTVK